MSLTSTMASHSNGLHNGAASAALSPARRFSEIPAAIDIPVHEGAEDEAVELDLVELPDDPTELCTLLENESVQKSYWMVIALAYAKQNQIDHAIEILTKGLAAFIRGRADDRLSILNALTWMYLWKCRDAPRIKSGKRNASKAFAPLTVSIEGPEDQSQQTKEYYMTLATASLNEASRISPSYPPLSLARGVLSLLRASIHLPTKAGPNGQDNSERAETLRQAARSFEDALRASNGKNIMAVVGKARVLFSLGKYGEALQTYQTVLERAPNVTDPDPRLGIGCCLWQLGHRDDARVAFERALDKNPESKFANLLLGIYWLQYSSQYSTGDAEFQESYKKAITQYVQKAFKADANLPLANSTFGGVFAMRQDWAKAEKLARKAIERTDVNAIASDGWYLLARMEHYNSNLKQASDNYIKADQARGGDDRGYLPAKFGAAQIRVILQDPDNAKFRLEKIIQHSKSIEAQTLLGILYAEEVFSAKASSMKKEDIAVVRKKAITLLEAVRVSWKDPKKKASPDSSILLNLARLYELDAPERALQCLKQVEEIEMDALPEEQKDGEEEDESAVKESLPPALLNNMAAFYYQSEKYSQARALFQTALNACIKADDGDLDLDKDAMVTSISFNLARTYEAEGQLDEAEKVYGGLLSRHPDYQDAIARLSYIHYLKNPEQGAKEMQEMLEDIPEDVDIRCLYGWFLNRVKKRTPNFAEDQEQRHNKHTLMKFDKYDPYILTSMGNICLTIAREMRKEEEKDTRRRMYFRAAEFFDRALSIEPHNAYAAQGVAIAVAEDRKDLASAVQIFTNVRETLKDVTVYLNLGHVFTELKQFSRAIESYEVALSKQQAAAQRGTSISGISEVSILTCLGRTWLMRGRIEKNLPALKSALDYSQRALELVPDQLHFQFNVAFVQFQIAQLIASLQNGQRTLKDVEQATTDLDAAIESLFAIAKAPNPPYSKHDLEQRATMGKNTIRKQVDRAADDQRRFEDQHASRLAAARQQRETDQRRREEARKAADEKEKERRAKIMEERKLMEERDREMAEARAEEERRREEDMMTTDPETGERVKRAGRKRGTGGGGKRRKKRDDDDVVSDGHLSDGEGGGRGGSRSRSKSAGADGEPRSRKKRKLTTRAPKVSKRASKFKSAEMIEDSDEELGGMGADDDIPDGGSAGDGLSSVADTPAALDGDESEIEVRPVQPRRPVKRVIDDDEDDDDDEDEDAGAANGTRDVKMADADDEGE
jgi:RNA polymerase-associated protein CTR9